MPCSDDRRHARRGSASQRRRVRREHGRHKIPGFPMQPAPRHVARHASVVARLEPWRWGTAVCAQTRPIRDSHGKLYKYPV
ncbi:hypothetical protein X977_3930 [Burkholderia pseudomallei MSHR7504]|nr:hypothetical protein X977_3930 [Burkholderia pseudomallei MSHR7504]